MPVICLSVCLHISQKLWTDFVTFQQRFALQVEKVDSLKIGDIVPA